MLALLGNNVLLLVTLQLLYLLKQLIEEEQGLRCKRLVEDLWVEVSSLHCHLDLLDKHSQLRRGRGTIGLWTRGIVHPWPANSIGHYIVWSHVERGGWNHAWVGWGNLSWVKVA